ncbi:MAG: PIG-L family deacetylase, partial [Elusimicrobia bacterium]|nr:PIG-L family deacetylase [Elusimicrobiota bacterium]
MTTHSLAFLLFAASAGASAVPPLPECGPVFDPAVLPELSAPLPDLPDFHSGEVFMVFAHADDEITVLGQVASIRRTHPTTKVHWLLVSDNAKGQVVPGTCPEADHAPDEAALRSAKSACRGREAAAAARAAGLGPPLQLTGLQDGGLAAVGTDELGRRIWAAIDALDRSSPEPVSAVFSSDASGLYGHP